MATGRGLGIVTDGLVLCLDAANKDSYPGSGTTWYDLGGQFSQSFNSGPTVDTTDGIIGLSYDGTDDYTLNSSNCNLTGSLTLIAVIEPDSSAGPIHNTVLCTDTNYRYGVKLMNFKNNDRWGLWLGFGAGSSPEQYEAFKQQDINDGNIKHIAGSWNQVTGQVKLYLNGVLSSTISTGVTLPIALYNGYIHTGVEYHSFGSGPYIGRIFTSMIYSRVLSDTEIQRNYNATKARFGL